jgi:hypothetical protein
MAIIMIRKIILNLNSIPSIADTNVPEETISP